MPELEFGLAALTLLSLVMGGLGLYWARGSRQRRRALWGYCLFFAALFFVSVSSLVAAAYQAEGLAPVGILAGALVVGMVWELPAAPQGEAV